MKNSIPDKAVLQHEYEADQKSRARIVKEIEVYLEAELAKLSSHLTIKGRIKSFHSFYKKYLRYLRNNPSQKAVLIPDTIGIRIICPFLEDIDITEQILYEKFEVIEIEKKGAGYSFKEFGYESHHILVQIPRCIGEKHKKSSGGDFSGEIAEIQIRTILQDAWAEVEHEFVYKAEFTPFGEPMKRKLAAINASLSLADTIFQEFRVHQRQLNGQLAERRTAFYKEIENSIDSFLLEGAEAEEEPIPEERMVDTSSIDELLLNALYAHNKGHFEQAELFYSRILTLNPDKRIKVIIHKHRGMANFSRSKYQAAIDDFSESIKIDPSAYTCAYLLGVVYSCLKDYPRAIDSFSRSLAIDSFQKYCFFRRAQAYYHIGDYPAALADCESVIALDCDFDSVKKLKHLLLDKLAP
ncbi:MAG: tetratricopeptide repeat protein [Spirochaetaceae bacterium]|jgi:putative GTP pyrophosphokinase|nr:tetratricopeptide repeat protein [Spirochaetaceae bacterium]